MKEVVAITRIEMKADEITDQETVAAMNRSEVVLVVVGVAQTTEADFKHEEAMAASVEILAVEVPTGTEDRNRRGLVESPEVAITSFKIRIKELMAGKAKQIKNLSIVILKIINLGHQGTCHFQAQQNQLRSIPHSTDITRTNFAETGQTIF